MEVISKTRKKYNVEKKISVKHFINMDVKGLQISGMPVYPIYFQLTYNRKNTRIRSRIKPIYKHHLEEQFVIFDKDYKELIKRDIILIEQLVKKYGNEFKEKEVIEFLPSLYHHKAIDLEYFIDWCLNEEIHVLIGKHKPDLNRFNPETKPLIHFEYFIDKVPELITIKEVYKSKIWCLNIILEQIKNRLKLEEEYNGLDHIFKNNDEYEDYYLVSNPSIEDFRDGYFQKLLLLFFEDSEWIKDVIEDMEKLFSKYDNDFFYKNFLR